MSSCKRPFNYWVASKKAFSIELRYKITKNYEKKDFIEFDQVFECGCSMDVHKDLIVANIQCKITFKSGIFK